MTIMEHNHKTEQATPLFINMLSTTIGWLLNEEELNRAVGEHMERIRELSSMSDRQLADLGITRNEITAYVLQENIDQ